MATSKPHLPKHPKQKRHPHGPHPLPYLLWTIFVRNSLKFDTSWDFGHRYPNLPVSLPLCQTPQLSSSKCKTSPPPLAAWATSHLPGPVLRPAPVLDPRPKGSFSGCSKTGYICKQHTTTCFHCSDGSIFSFPQKLPLGSRTSFQRFRSLWASHKATQHRPNVSAHFALCLRHRGPSCGRMWGLWSPSSVGEVSLRCLQFFFSKKKVYLKSADLAKETSEVLAVKEPRRNPCLAHGLT